MQHLQLSLCVYPRISTCTSPTYRENKTINNEIPIVLIFGCQGIYHLSCKIKTLPADQCVRENRVMEGVTRELWPDTLRSLLNCEIGIVYKSFEIWAAIIRINTEGKSLIMKLVPGRLLVTKRYVKQKCQRNAQTNNKYKLHIFKLLYFRYF